MRLSHFIEAVSLKELRVQHPELEKDLEFALGKGLLNKYFHWLANHRIQSPNYAIDKLVDLGIKFDKALVTKKIDKLIAEGKLPGTAKDIGIWTKPTIDLPDKTGVPTLEAMEDALKGAEELKSRTETKATGADKIYDDGRIAVFSPKTKETVCLLGAGTKWCITQKKRTHYEDYSKRGVIFVYVIDTDPIPIGNRNAKLAIAINIFENKKPENWEYFDAEDRHLSHREVSVYYGKRWPIITDKVKAYAATAEYRGERGKDDFWFGDVIRIRPPKGKRVASIVELITAFHGPRGKYRSKGEHHEYKNSFTKTFIRLLDGVPDMEDPKDPGKLAIDALEGQQGKLSRQNIERYLFSTEGLLTPKGVVWNSTGNKVVDAVFKALDITAPVSYVDQYDLERYFLVVKPLDPQESIKKYGGEDQPGMDN